MHARWWAPPLALAVLVLVLLLPSFWARTRSAKRIHTSDGVPRAEFALVLGAGVRRDGTPSRILQGRLEVAEALHRSGRVRRILVSGSPRSRGFSEPEVMRNSLVSRGIPADVIRLDESGVDTWSSCRSAARAFGLRQLTVVSTNFHLPRAVSLCRRAGIDAHGVGHDAVAEGLRRVAARGNRREKLATIKAFWWRR